MKFSYLLPDVMHPPRKIPKQNYSIGLLFIASINTTPNDKSYEEM